MIDTELTIAERIARQAHAGQVDQNGAPYIEHVARVAAAVEPQYRAVAWLHDVIEDTKENRETLLAAGITAETIDAVEVLTKRKNEQGEAVYLRLFIERVASSGNVAALAVKRADLLDNLRPGKPGSIAKYQAALVRLASTRGPAL